MFWFLWGLHQQTLDYFTPTNTGLFHTNKHWIISPTNTGLFHQQTLDYFTNTGLFHQQKPFLANNWTTWTNFFQPQPQISKASKVVHTTEYNRSDQDGSKGKNRSFVLHLHKNCDEIHGSVFNPKIIPKDSGSQGLCPWTPVAMALISWLYTSHPNRKF